VASLISRPVVHTENRFNFNVLRKHLIGLVDVIRYCVYWATGLTAGNVPLCGLRRVLLLNAGENSGLDARCHLCYVGNHHNPYMLDDPKDFPRSGVIYIERQTAHVGQPEI
jgi:hypothetical protein